MVKRLVLLCSVMLIPMAAVSQRHAQSNSGKSDTHLTEPADIVNSLPVGTEIKMRLETALSTSGNQAGDTFSGRVTKDVVYEGKTVIPVGSTLQGRVIRSSESRRVKGLPTLSLHPDQVILPNGDKFTLAAVVVDTDAPKISVDDEGRIKGDGMDGRDKVQIASGAGAGLAIGAIAGGGKGALIGSAIGGGAAVVYWLTKHKTMAMRPGTEIVVELSRPMTMNAASD